MGWSGPVPKHSRERRRRNKRDGLDLLTIPTAPAGDADVPPADETWHPTASAWYASLCESSQSSLYQPSDWAQARLVAELMTRSLRGGPPSGQLVQGVRQAMAGLLSTEGDRRRAGIETARH
ncbi:hypothetical protein [Streptomyces sp. NPDC056242]|uniref:phage terminase small subunit n=1 Tax=Streptomyces sp. NPDC056242 TaxID=3345760 RepID=UPI0035DE92CB